MSNLLTKSSENYKVAHALISSGQNLAPSVHCSYYACLQTVIHILSTSQSSLTLINNGAASHESLINELTKKLGTDFLAVKEFNKIRDLKKYRKESDYTNQIISLPTATKAQEISLELKMFFKNKFGVKLP
ncbi:MAG: hypothetical protein WC150_04735 [Bacteroidia bacterium]